MNLEELVKFLSHSPNDWIWVGNVFLVVFLTLLARYFQTRISKKLMAKAEHDHKIWDNALIYAADRPLGYFLWLIGFTFAALIVEDHFTNKAAFAWIEPARTLGTIGLFSWTILRFLTRMEENLIKPPKGKEPVNKTTALAIGRLLRIAVMITTVLVSLQALDIPVTGFLALGSAGTVVVGIASKDLLANFFGGLMIFMDRQFTVGDWIRSPDKSIEGTVEHIGWRLTRIRTFDKRPLYVPNSTFLTISIENPSRMTNRRIRENLGLRYKDATKLPTITTEIENMLRNHPEIDTKQTLFVTLHSLGQSSLDCQIYCFTKTTQWVPFMKIQQDIFCKIAAIVKEHGGDIAFPTTTIDLPEESPLAK